VNDPLTLMPFITMVATIIRLLIWALIIYVIIKSIKKAKTHLNTIISDVSGPAVGSCDYKHPCVGQCENPDIILNKSPTPKYQHNNRVLDKFAPQSGRYYRGKQRKHLW